MKNLITILILALALTYLFVIKKGSCMPLTTTTAEGQIIIYLDEWLMLYPDSKILTIIASPENFRKIHFESKPPHSLRPFGETFEFYYFQIYLPDVPLKPWETSDFPMSPKAEGPR